MYLRAGRAQPAAKNCASEALDQGSQLSIGCYRLAGRRGCSLFNELGCFLRVRHVGYMARFHFDRLGVGALCHHALLIRIDRSVFAGHHVKGRLMLPGGILNLVGEGVGRDRDLRYSHELRLIPWNVRCKVGDEMRLVNPPEPVAVRCECLGCLRHCLFDICAAFTFIEGKGGNVDKCFNVRMIAGLGYDGAAVAVTDQNDRPPIASMAAFVYFWSSA